MPHAGDYREGLIFLADRQASVFARPQPVGSPITDKKGVARRIFSGKITVDEEHYGVFEGPSLIASLSLTSPSLAYNCPTPYWSIGMIEVTNAFQDRGIGSRLLDAAFALRNQPLASDLNQDGGGADLWRRWIKNHPGKIELYDPTGSLGIITESSGNYSPDPWEKQNTRLVRNP